MPLVQLGLWAHSGFLLPSIRREKTGILETTCWIPDHRAMEKPTVEP